MCCKKQRNDTQIQVCCIITIMCYVCKGYLWTIQYLGSIFIWPVLLTSAVGVRKYYFVIKIVCFASAHFGIMMSILSGSLGKSSVVGKCNR